MRETFVPLHKRITEIVEKNKNKDFLYYQDKKYTYKEMDNMVNKLVNSFCKIGVKKGSKVAFMLPSSDFFIFCLLANIKIGSVTIPINLNHQGMSLQHIINQSEAEFIIYTDESHSKLLNIKKELNNVKKIITYNVEENKMKDWHLSVNQLEKYIENSSEKIEYELSNDIKRTDLMEIMYTSGTTGPPKGVIWDQAKFDTNISDDIPFNSSDVMYTPLPLFHALAQRMLFMCLINGATFAIATKFSASRFWEDIDKYQATWFNYIGAIIPILLKQPISKQDKLQCAKNAYGCGAPQDKAIWNEFSERFHVKLYEYYGTTESGAITLGTEPGSIGKPRKTHDVKIINENKEECKAGEIGELLSRVKNSNYDFKGYYKMEKESNEKVIDGWVKSGDLVYKDEKGYFYFSGRKVESMRRRGENISPWEIESVINSHPKIIESAAVPIKADIGEDEVKVCIVLKENEQLSIENLLAYCKGRMAKYLVPRYVEFKEYLPKTSTEKIERVKLKKEGLTQKTVDCEIDIQNFV